MKRDNWKFDEDDGASIASKENIYIPWLDIKIPVWFEIEEGENWWSKNQLSALNNFISLKGIKNSFIQEIEILPKRIKLRKNK